MFTCIQDDAAPCPFVRQDPMRSVAVEDDGPPPRSVALQDSRVVRLAHELAALKVAQRQRPREPDVVLVHMRHAVEILVHMAGRVAEAVGHLAHGVPEDLQEGSHDGVLVALLDRLVIDAPDPAGAPKREALIVDRDGPPRASGGRGRQAVPGQMVQNPEGLPVELCELHNWLVLPVST